MGSIIPIMIISVVVAGFGLVIWRSIESTKCTTCGGLFAHHEVAKKELSRKKGYKTIERTSKSNTGNTERWQEQIRVLIVEYLYRYRCPHCGHEWTIIDEVEFDTFTD